MSAEPSRKAAYSNDLRWRIVYQRLGMGYSYAKIAQSLNISEATACRIFNRFQLTGSVDSYRVKRGILAVFFGNGVHRLV